MFWLVEWDGDLGFESNQRRCLIGVMRSLEETEVRWWGRREGLVTWVLLVLWGWFGKHRNLVECGGTLWDFGFEFWLHSLNFLATEIRVVLKSFLLCLLICFIQTYIENELIKKSILNIYNKGLMNRLGMGSTRPSWIKLSTS